MIDIKEYFDTDCIYMIRKPNTILTAYDVIFIIMGLRFKTPMYTFTSDRIPKLTVSGHMINIAMNMILGGEY